MFIIYEVLKIIENGDSCLTFAYSYYNFIDIFVSHTSDLVPLTRLYLQKTPNKVVELCLVLILNNKSM